MGIPGLTTYISNHSERYLENYALHDIYLVIDGNSVACQLYNWHTRGNCAFGGDYDRYGRCVSDFFDELLKCNVTPLVLIDGGCEDKKLKTIITRTREKIQTASYYTPFSHNRNKFLPLLLREVFKDVMTEKGVRYAQCLFEADNTIAAIARILNCPVLSYDSDFFIYGSLYIPFNTWENYVIRNPAGRGYIKRCKIYNVEKLFQDYNGLNQSLLPLAAVLLGNDYVKQRTFRNFFQHLKLPPTGKRMYNDQQRRIVATFNWLRRYSLNQAVIEILSRLRKQKRKHILNTIETIINGYINASLSVLVILGIPTENFSKANIQDAFRTYKFEGDIYKLTYIEEKPNEADLSDDDETDESEMASILQEMELASNETLVNNLPQWFINEFKLAKFASYFIDLIIRKLYVCPTQIEDYVRTSSIMASLKIISVIYGLLISEIRKKKTDMSYMTRDERKVKRYRLEYNDTIFGCKLPSLSNLREVPIIIRKEILNNTLGICDESCMNQIPSVWTLYIATIKYWIDQQQDSSAFNCHIYSLLLTMLFNIIDHKIGFYRILNSFLDKFHKTVQNIQFERKTRNYQSQYSIDSTLVDAIHEVNTDDCLIAASSFFLSKFEVDRKIYSQTKKFNITVVHDFAEFQNCLRHSMHLNALLGYPYEQTKVANVFNGTLLYNLCVDFKKRNDVEAYISSILQNSPSLLRLFNVLLSKVKPLFDITLEKKTNKYKKQKTRRKEHSTQEEHSEEETTKNESVNETSFHDVNNPFSVLSTMQQ